jgi:RNA polymerase sigma-70 factor (ECF subfamily)
MDSARTVQPPEFSRLLEAARAGDEAAFQDLVEPHRRELNAHCYRMLASMHDAEDAMQETFFRAWRSIGTFKGEGPLRPWLYKIATNVCLDISAKRRRRLLPPDVGPPTGPTSGPGAPDAETPWLEPYPDEALADESTSPESRYEMREAVELAFIAALQHLPPQQRAVLILREVLAFSAREVAEALDTSTASVNSSLQRARKAVDERLPEQSQQATMRALGDDALREIVDNYVAAWESRDVDAMVAMLVEDATFAMPPHPYWFIGRDAIVTFITGAGRVAIRPVAVSANGQPAIAWYMHDARQDRFVPASLEVLTLEGDRVRGIVAFATADLFAKFDLPAWMPSAAPG